MVTVSPKWILGAPLGCSHRRWISGSKGNSETGSRAESKSPIRWCIAGYTSTGFPSLCFGAVLCILHQKAHFHFKNERLRRPNNLFWSYLRKLMKIKRRFYSRHGFIEDSFLMVDALIYAVTMWIFWARTGAYSPCWESSCHISVEHAQRVLCSSLTLMLFLLAVKSDSLKSDL